MFIEINVFGSLLSVNVNQIISIKNYGNSTFIQLTHGEKVSFEEDYYSFISRLNSLSHK